MADPADQVRVPDDHFGPFTIREVQECFEAFDLDENGFVGAGELKKVYQVLGESTTDEDIDEMLRMCDLDGDGQITFDEFAKMIFRHSGPPKMESQPTTSTLSVAQQEQELQSAETILATTNTKSSQKLPPIKGKNGLIQEESDRPKSKKEKIRERERILTTKERADRAFVLSNMIKRLDFNNKNLDQVQASFEKVDSEKTGTVNYKEFANALEEDSENQVVRTLFSLFEWNDKVDYREFLIAVVNINASNRDQKIKYAFNIFDVDHNGYIDKQELVKILKSAHMTSYEQVEKKANAILKQADQDGNGILSLNELTAVATKFPNLIFPDFNLVKK